MLISLAHLLLIEKCFVGHVCAVFNKDLFPEVTFENSPKEVELNFVSNENN